MSVNQDDRESSAFALAEEALRLRAHYRGKVQIAPRCPVRDLHDFSFWYTPGVAASCRAIVADPERVWEQTNRSNAIAIVSDGSRVLGLGNIGPEAGLPVMEGKSLLFKVLGGVDATPLCIRVRDDDELICTVVALEPSFGGVNLEDIASPRRFRVLDALQERMKIPVWHDDQQGTATVLLAALTNALEIVEKPFDTVRIAMVGVGAANVAVYRLLTACGIDPGGIVACDTGGTLHSGRDDLEARQGELGEKWRICRDSNAGRVVGGIAEALRGADVCIALSTPGPGIIHPEWIRDMASDAILPTMEEWQVYPRIAAATAMAAQDEGLTEFKRTRESVLDEATKKIQAARELAEAIVYAGGTP